MRALALACLVLLACSRPDPGATAAAGSAPSGHGMQGMHHGHHGMEGMHGGPAGSAGALAEVARVHGEAGPWAVAGYRMGQFALTKLGLSRQSFDLDVTHRGPLEPQYACVADGASAATGASVGKVNLKLEAATAAELATVYRRKSTGQSLTLRPTAAFKQRFLDVPREQLRHAGEQVLGLRDEEIFEEVP